MKSNYSWKRALGVAAVWLAVFVGWEAAYRIIDWKPYVFPAPSHVVDSVMQMVGVKTYFGDPVWITKEVEVTTVTGVEKIKQAQPFQWDAQWPLHGEGLHMQIEHVKFSPDFAHSPMRAVRVLSFLDGNYEIPTVQMLTALVVSLVRLAIGFALSVGIGLVVGLAMFRFKFIDALLGPLFLGLQTLPSVCWVPLAVLAIGINETGILFVTVMGSCFAFAITLRDGLRTTPPIYRSAGLVFGAHGLRFYTQVMLPAGLPALAGALRSGFSFAWRSLMGGELIFVLKQHGVGHLLATGREYGDVAQVVASMILMVLIGMAADRLLFAPVEHRIRARFGL